MKNYLFVFFGGGLGASARYWLSGAVYRFVPVDFPYGTLIVNLLGCFIIGLLMSALEDRFIAAPSIRIFLTIGIIGGFTTFSSFSYETISLFRNAEFFRAGLNVVASMTGCLASTYFGFTLGKLI